MSSHPFKFVPWIAGACMVASVLITAQTPQTPGTHVANTYAQADIEYGALVYGRQCSTCHGPNGDGVPGFDLRAGKFRNANTDGDLRGLIANGVNSMPGIGLDTADLAAVVAYLRNMNSFDTSSLNPGNADRGKALVEGSKGGCLTCHRIDFVGSLMAPELSDVGSRRSAGYLQRTLLDPDLQMLPINRPVRVVTRDGRKINARRLNEDSYTVQLADQDGTLISLLKADLREFTILTKSPMPSFRDKLSPTEMADVLSYLLSLKGQLSPASYGLQARTPVPFERLVNAAKEPHNWLTYSGTYASHRYSQLTQMTTSNVKSLELAWAYQGAAAGSWQPSPLVVDGIMYLTQRPNDVVALDAATGAIFWIYRYTSTAPNEPDCCGSQNRGLAILEDTLFEGTLDAHLIAIDAKTGRLRWNTAIGNPDAVYSITHAPLVVKDKVIVGMAGAEYGIRGFIAAYDAKTGKEAWRFYTIPEPGQPGNETWEPCPPNSPTYCDPEAWKHGGGSVWVTGSYDPELNLTYWGIGNAGPDYAHEQRPGDNLYTCSVVALDADTGAIKWHYQFTPHDRYDWDSVQVPVLVDMPWQGKPIKAMLWGNRNGNFYVLDRTTGKFLLGKAFTKTNWYSGFDKNGRPIQTPQPAGKPTYPAIQGGTNWYSPSYSPRTRLMYVNSWQDYGQVYQAVALPYDEGRPFTGGMNQSFVPLPGDPTEGIRSAQGTPGLRRGPINTWTEAAATGSVLAIDPNTGNAEWRFSMNDVSLSGIVTTASDLLFVGGRDGYFQVLDARSGTLLWKRNLGGQLNNAPVTYAVKGRQYVSVIAGLTLYTFALPDKTP